jgi:hypothetical protein
MGALLDEGPVRGISAYEHAQEAIRLYLYHASTHAKTLKHLWHVLNVPSTWGEEIPVSRETIAARDEITGREAWRAIDTP